MTRFPLRGALQRRSLTSSSYIEHTVIPTYHFQDSLPKLPIPSLKESNERYDYFSKPMATNNEAYAKTLSIAKEFFETGAKPLQEELIKRDKAKYSSFISDPWFDMYLENRAGLMINLNPQLTFNDAKDSSRMNQIDRATDLIYSSMRFYRTLTDGKLSPDIFHTKPAKSRTDLYNNLMKMIPKRVSFYGSYYFGAYPLDMSQYERLFSSTRVPKRGKDILVKYSEEESRHIVIQKGSAFYKVDVLETDGSLKSKSSIKSSLKIIGEKDNQSNDYHLGLLTSTDRDKWAETREELLALSEKNRESLHLIDSAMFVVCLDDSIMNNYEECSVGMLYGNANNRWFDKSFQLIVSKNGKAAVNFEHAWGDGVAVLRYFNSIFDDSNQSQLAEVNSKGNLSEITFDLDDSVKHKISAARRSADNLINKLEFATLESDLLDKKFCKQYKIGADGCLQMTFQLAHYLMHGNIKATYESASTAGFKHGRTETIRSATPEAKLMVEALGDAKSTDSEKKKSLLKAISNHGRITKNALLGKGLDRHLFALKVIAEQQGLMSGAVADFYNDETMTNMNHFILSTSTLASPALQAGGFGPVNDDNYGIGYGITNDGFATGVMSFSKGSAQFRDCIREAAGTVRALVES